jgi:hypothetical protein
MIGGAISIRPLWHAAVKNFLSPRNITLKKVSAIGDTPSFQSQWHVTRLTVHKKPAISVRHHRKISTSWISISNWQTQNS